MSITTQRSSRRMLLAIIAVYIVSLASPSVYRHGFGSPTSGLSGSVVSGYEILCDLPFALLAPLWWANPVWLLGVVAFAQRKLELAWYCGLVGTLLALSALFIGPFPPDNFSLSHFHIGFYVWLGSMIALLAAAQREIANCKRFEKVEDLAGTKRFGP